MKRSLSDGAIAGTVVGVVFGVGLIVFCLYPVIVGLIKRRRRRHLRETQQPFDPEAGMVATADAQPVVLPSEAFGRRLSSASSIKPQRTTSGREFGSQGSKDQGQARDGGAPSTYSTHLPHNTSTYPDVQQPGDHFFPQPSDDQSTPFPTYDGPYYPGADGTEPKGTNAEYYSPSIPSEAFGMYDMPMSAEPEDTASRTRANSLRNSVKNMLRRASGRDRTMSSIGSGDVPVVPEGAVLDRVVSHKDPTDSPTQMSPTLASPPGGGASRGLSHGDADMSPPPVDRSLHYSSSPPRHPAPGTVNPMDIMPATTQSEMWHRTEHELFVSAQPSPLPAQSPPLQQQPEYVPVVESPSPSSSEPPSASLPSSQSRPNGAVQHETESTQNGDIEMANAPTQNYLCPNPDPGRHHSYPSDQSTPFPGPASTVPSTLNTPSTQIDSPSPGSSAEMSSDFRNSASPGAKIPSPRSGQGHWACEMPGCGQVFDQHHKLK